MISQVYAHAQYYDIAFGFVDIPGQIDRFEEFIRQHSGVHVSSVFDICCGPSRQLREFARRGCRSVGLDISLPMLDYLHKRASNDRVEVEAIQGDMLDFTLDDPVDFAYNLMGSILLVRDNPGMLSHLSSLARCLRPGGLYAIENLNMDSNCLSLREPMVWDMEEDGIKVQSTYSAKLVDSLEQTVHETLDLQVNDNGKETRLTDHGVTKLFYPQEFRMMVELQGHFELVGYFERDTTAPLQAVSADNIVLLRKKGKPFDRREVL